MPIELPCSQRTAALLLLIALSTSAPLRGQSADSLRASDSLRVQFALPPIVVTATRVPTRADRLGISTTVLTERDLRDRSPFHAYDALRAVPGIFFDESVGPGGPTNIRLRGGEEFHTQVRVDGVEINQRGGSFDLRGLGLSGIDRIEVVRGPQSALHGTSAVNGTVQFLTSMGEAVSEVAAEVEGGAAAENDRSLRGSGELSGGQERFRYRVGGGGSKERGIYDLPNDTWIADGFARLDFFPSTAWQLTGNGRFIRTESKLPVRDAGVTRAPLDPTAGDEKDRAVTSLAVTYRGLERWSHRLALTAFNEDGTYSDRRDGVTPSDEFFILDFDFALRSDLWRTGAEWVSSYDARAGSAEGGLVVSIGARAEREDLHTELTGDFGNETRDLKRDALAAFGEVQVALAERWDVLLGARMDRFQGIDAELSPRASTVFHAVPGRFDLRGAVGKAFKAPSLEVQFPNNAFIASNPDLGPEQAWTGEVGADLTGVGGRVDLAVTAWAQRFEGLIRTVPQPDPEPGDARQVNVNLGKSRAYGADWLVRWRLASPFAIGSEGGWLSTEMIDNRGLGQVQYPEGEELPFRPSVRASAFLEFADWYGLSGIVRGTHVGEQLVLTERFSGRREPIESYVVVDVSARYTVSPTLELYTRFTNLLDSEHDTSFDRPGAPLRGAFGVRLVLR